MKNGLINISSWTIFIGKWRRKKNGNARVECIGNAQIKKKPMAEQTI